MAEYISFGPVANPDGTPTEFTKQFFGVTDEEVKERMAIHANSKLGRQDPDFQKVKEELANVGLVFQSSVPDIDGMFIVIAWHPIKGTFSTHATSYDNSFLVWGHYDFPTFEAARIDALKRALHED